MRLPPQLLEDRLIKSPDLVTGSNELLDRRLGRPLVALQERDALTKLDCLGCQPVDVLREGFDKRHLFTPISRVPNEPTGCITTLPALTPPQT